MTRARKLCLLLAVLAMTPASPVFAQSADAARADALFRDAQKLLERGKVHEACEEFAESQQIDPALGTLLNLADCHAQEGKIALARVEFASAAELAAERKQKEREDFARAQAAELSTKLARVTLSIAPNAGVDAVAIDGNPLDPRAWTDAAFLGPGAHTIVASGNGKRSRTVTLNLAAGEHALVIDPLADALPPPIVPSPAVLPRVPGPEEDRGGARTAGFVVLGAGVVALGAGVYFGVRAKSQKQDGDAHCAGKYCDDAGLAFEQDAHTSATLSTIAFGAGIVGVGVGAYLVLAPQSPQPHTTALRVDPSFGAHDAGLRLRGSF
jgi:tetratricopeptide (TPR) repeat protein